MIRQRKALWNKLISIQQVKDLSKLKADWCQAQSISLHHLCIYEANCSCDIFVLWSVEALTDLITLYLDA